MKNKVTPSTINSPPSLSGLLHNFSGKILYPQITPFLRDLLLYGI